MDDQVRVAAGIHMTTFKSQGDTAADVEAKASNAREDLNISDWTPDPALMAQFRGG